MADPTPSPETPQLRDQRPKHGGFVPKNAQSWLIIGVAALMITIMTLSHTTAPKINRSTSSESASVFDPNATQIQAYEKEIAEQTRKLQIEQAGLTGTPSAANTVAAGTPYSGPTLAGTSYLNNNEPTDPLQDDLRKREYESRFASNVALSYRTEPSKSELVPSQPVAGAASAAKSESHDSPASQAHERDAALQGREVKRYRIFEGTVLETVLTNRLDGSFSGPVNCMATADVYSNNGLHLLIPQGTRILGEVRKVENFGESRLAVVFHRMIMPDGYSVSLDRFQGLDAVGETGLKDQINHHYIQIFGVSIALGGIAGLSQANTNYGLNESAADAYRQGVANSLSQSSMHILDRYLNVLPTVTIREGQRVKVYLSEDVLLPAYDQHDLPNDL